MGSARQYLIHLGQMPTLLLPADCSFIMTANSVDNARSALFVNVLF